MITLLVAMNDENLIGNDDKLPWHLPGELKLFRKRTMGGVLIMGRKTWQSLPCYKTENKYLDGRVNFVITRNAAELAEQNPASGPEGPHFADTIELAIENARRDFPEYAGEFFIIGGRQIYELALRKNLVDRMFITHVKGKHAGNVHFPDFGDEWVGRPEIENKTYDVYEYVKRPNC